MRKLRIEQLSAESGISVSTIRYYQKNKLLQSPQKEGRIALYGASHLSRLKEIRRLLGNGFSLRQIHTLKNTELNGKDPVLAALDSGRPMTYEALVEKSGLSSDIVDLAIQSGLVQSVPGKPNRFYPGAADMLSVASQLISAGVDMAALLKLALDHSARIEKTAEEAVKLFAENIRSRKSKTTRAEVSEKIKELVPQTTTLVSKHFQQTLVLKAAEYASS